MIFESEYVLLALLVASHAQFYFERRRLLDRIMAKNLSDLVSAEAERLKSTKPGEKKTFSFEV